MKLLRKYIISGIAITIGCLLIYVFYDPVLGLCMISLTFFFISVKSTKWREPIEFKRPKWNPVSFYKGAVILFGICLILIVYIYAFKEIFESLKKWYFVSILWLFCLSILVYSYFKENNCPTSR